MNLSIIGKIILLIFISYFSFVLITASDPWIIVDNFNLIVHEVGHIVFLPFGTLISFLGGTLLQLIVPIVFLVYFLTGKSKGGISFCLFWIGDNLINVARYIKDARAMELPLVFGGVHDWNWILGQWNLLDEDIAIGNTFQNLGIFFLIISIIFLIYNIWLDFKNIQLKQIAINTPYEPVRTKKLTEVLDK